MMESSSERSPLGIICQKVYVFDTKNKAHLHLILTFTKCQYLFKNIYFHIIITAFPAIIRNNTKSRPFTETYTFLQKNLLTKTWHFRKFSPYIGRWTSAIRKFLPLPILLFFHFSTFDMPHENSPEMVPVVCQTEHRASLLLQSLPPGVV